MEQSQDTQTTANPTSATNLSTWPGAFGIYQTSRDAIKLNIGLYLGLIAIAIVVNILLNSILKDNLSGIVSWVINAFFMPATIAIFLGGLKGRKLSFDEVTSVGLNFFFRALGLSLLVFLALGVSLLLLILPFFFVLPRLVLANYYLVDKNMGPVEAFKASWDHTKGHSLKVWGVILVGILMALLALTIIGIPVAIYLLLMYSAALAALYLHISKQPESRSSKSSPTGRASDDSAPIAPAA